MFRAMGWRRPSAQGEFRNSSTYKLKHRLRASKKAHFNRQNPYRPIGHVEDVASSGSSFTRRHRFNIAVNLIRLVLAPPDRHSHREKPAKKGNAGTACMVDDVVVIMPCRAAHHHHSRKPAVQLSAISKADCKPRTFIGPARQLAQRMLS